jgi:nucleotidyltransferase/DNA polymerase involved in DNA repair
VGPPVVTSGTRDKEFKNRENTLLLKTGSFSSGEKSREIAIQESVKQAITPILKDLMAKLEKDGTIYKHDKVSQEVETGDQHTEKEKLEACNLW